MHTNVERAIRPQDRPVRIHTHHPSVALDRAVSAPATWNRLHAIPVPTNLPTDPLLLRLAYSVFEIALTVGLLIATAPLMLLQAIAIKLDSPGPALFWEDRPARSIVKKGRELMNDSSLIPPDGGFQPDQDYLVPQTFRFAKFRTMFVDTRPKGSRPPRFPDHETAMRSYYKDKEDPRVTRVGGFLRRTTLDELPNLIHVLTGHMRLVGPRPEVMSVIPYYSAEQMALLTVKPGVTGLAQSTGRSDLAIGERLACDLEYLRTRSVWMDIKILAMTFVGVLIRRGAY